MITTFKPCRLVGTMEAPPSKSMAHRYLIGAALSGEECTLSGVDYSEDILATLDCLRALGVGITADGDTVTVEPQGFMAVDDPILSCRESGSTLRFFIPLALCLGKTVTLRGSERLFERPLEAYGELCRERGFTFIKGKASLTLRGKLDSLNAHLADLMRRNGKSEQYIADHKFTFHDVVIVASLIEKESGNAAESFNIASVIYNRLYNWGGTPAYLNIDAAIIYAMDGDASHIDTGFDSPYNTYLHAGLTPGPIANPGMSSLEAALNPASTGYYYYVLNPATGQHTFSKTLEEHEKLVEKYRQARAN